MAVISNTTLALIRFMKKAWMIAEGFAKIESEETERFVAELLMLEKAFDPAKAEALLGRYGYRYKVK